MKITRAAILAGTYKGYTLVVTTANFRKEVYLFNAVTLAPIGSMSLTAAAKHAGLGFANFKAIAEVQGTHNGVIYSYTSTL